MFNNVHGYCAICKKNLDHDGCYYVMANGRFHLCEDCNDVLYSDPDLYPAPENFSVGSEDQKKY